LRSDGTGDCGKHERDFDLFAKSRGYAGIVSQDDYEVPVRPDDAFAREAYGRATRDDNYDINMFNKANTPYLNRCSTVMECWKRAKTQQPVLTWLEMEHRLAYENASKENLFILRDAFMTRWGGWTTEKGKANYIEALLLPQIKNVKSADDVFVRMHELRLERNSWLVEQYDDTYYKGWLMEHIK
jgi:hypothetical protein